jgi:hypothetical protein
MKPAIAWFVWAGVVVGPTVARADPATPNGSLTWSRAPSAASCIAEEALATDVERLLGRPVFRPTEAADLHVEGHVELQPDGWHATLTLSSGAELALGRRELRSSASSCRALDESLALAIALMIDPDALLRPDVKGAESVPLAQVEDDAVHTPTALPDPPLPANADRGPSPPANPAEGRPWRLEADAEATVAFGLLPGAGTGLAARLLLSPPSFWAIAVEGTFWRETDARASSGGSGIGLEQGGILLCPFDVRRSRLSLLACAGMQAGKMSAAGFGFDANYSASSTLYDTTAAAHARYRLVGPVTALVGVSLGVPLNPYRFVYRDPNGETPEVFRVAPVFAALDLGVGAEWP